MDAIIIAVAVVALVGAGTAATAINAGNALKERARRMAAELFVAASLPPRTVTEEALAPLPVPVARWLRRSGVVGRPAVRTVRLRQRGEFRQKPGQRWKPFEAEEYFSVDPPGFVWFSTLRMAPLIPLSGIDSYRAGSGHMLIRLLNLYPVADFRGSEIDQGTLLRFLNEIMWFPSAALSPSIRWSTIDDNRARAVMTDGDTEVEALFEFSDEGDLLNMSADRYREQSGGFDLVRWSTPIRRWGEVNGLRVPISGDAIWHLASGDFSYVRLTVTALDYDPDQPFTK